MYISGDQWAESRRSWGETLDCSTILADESAGVDVLYVRNFLDVATLQALESELQSYKPQFEAEAQRPSPVQAPRLCLAFGDVETSFGDLGTCLPWPLRILEVGVRIGTTLDQKFNFALANWYRDGSDYTGWHADKIAFHEPQSMVAIVSVGADREIAFRQVGESRPVVSQELEAGSLLLMSFDTHRHFEHSVLANPDLRDTRMSLTYRNLLAVA